MLRFLVRSALVLSLLALSLVPAAVSAAPPRSPLQASATATLGIVTQFPLNGATACATTYSACVTAREGITAGPDGNLWFIASRGNGSVGEIGRLTPTGVVTYFPLPQETNAGALRTIVTGADGNLWFTESNFAPDMDKIGRMTISGLVTEFLTPTQPSVPYDITPGPDGNLWFTEYDPAQIAKITPAGIITEFPLPPGDAPTTTPRTRGVRPTFIVTGPDGNLWFTEECGNAIARITLAGAITEFPQPGYRELTNCNQAGVAGIAVGSDGNLWFISDSYVGKITTSGDMTQYPIPLGIYFQGGGKLLATGPDGNLWIGTSNGIAQITTTGVVTDFNLYPATGGSVVTGPDRNLWYTGGGSILRITPTISSNQAELLITNTTSSELVMVGRQLTYTLAVLNNGPANATGVIMKDTLPSGVSFISATASQGSCSTGANITCTIGSLAGGALATITVVVQGVSPGSVTNSAVVKGDQPDPDQTNNSSSTTVKIIQETAVVLLQGIGTGLTSAQIQTARQSCTNLTDPFSFPTLVKDLVALGFTCSDLLLYSYTGGSVTTDATHRWVPNPYSCRDTRTQTLGTDTIQLQTMLRLYRRDHPGVRFVLLGHSLGGVIAFQTAPFLGFPPGSIPAVVTIDSPLNHASRKNLIDVERVVPFSVLVSLANCQAHALLNSIPSSQLGDVNNGNRQTIRREQESLVTRGHSNGTAYMTTGNEQDCAWYLSLCKMPRRAQSGAFLPGDWIDDRATMTVANADLPKLYPLGTGGCDLSTNLPFSLTCLLMPHGAALSNDGVLNDILEFVSSKL